MQQFMRDNWKFVLTIIFLTGAAYASLSSITREVDKQGEKIEKHETRIVTIEKSQAVTDANYQNIMRSLEEIKAAVNSRDRRE